MKHVIYGEDGQIIEERDLPDAPTSPKALTFVEFFALAYGHGLTAAKYTEARQNPNMAIFFDMLQAAQGIQKDDPFTQMGADAFVSAGILTAKQRAAIFSNWPEV